MTLYQHDLRRVKVPDLSALSGSNILVTGSTGLVGSCLVELLLLYAEQYHYDVYAGCRDVGRARARLGDNRRLHYAVIDVIQPIQGDEPYHYIVDAASNGSPNFFATDPVGVMKANLLGVCNILDYGIERGLRRFLYISSGEVYGEGGQGKWQERDCGYVNSMSMRACYPSSKRASETLCVAYAYQFGVDAVVARLCHTYGPGFTDSDNRVYAQFIRNVLKDQDIVLKSRGEQYRSWLYVVDCAAAILYILINGQSKEAYNVANDESNITIRDLAELVSCIAQKKVVYDLPSDIEMASSTVIKRAVFDTEKLESLGWMPLWGIREGMEHTIQSLMR